MRCCLSAAMCVTRQHMHACMHACMYVCICPLALPTPTKSTTPTPMCLPTCPACLQHRAQDRIEPEAAQGTAAGRGGRRRWAGPWGALACSRCRPLLHSSCVPALPCPIHSRHTGAHTDTGFYTEHTKFFVLPVFCCSPRWRHRQDDCQAALPGRAGVWQAGQAGAGAGQGFAA